MDTITNAYGSDSDTESTPTGVSSSAPTSTLSSSVSGPPGGPYLVNRSVNSAPFVNPALKTVMNRPGFIPPTSRELTTNVKAATLLAPIQGPEHPFRREMDSMGGTKLATGGYKEDAVMEKWNFHEQFHTFHAQGYARDDVAGGIIGNVHNYMRKEGLRDPAGPTAINAGRVTKPSGSTALEPVSRRKRKGVEEDEDLGEEEDGPWAPAKEEPVITQLEAGTLTEEQKRHRAELAERKAAKHRGYDEDEDLDRRDERKVAHLLPPRHDRDTVASEPTTQFHGKGESDYQGRSWVEPPGGLRPVETDHACYLPKRCVHRYTGHGKGVQAIEFFPGTGHLLLSASLDGTCKVWSVYDERQLRRTYSGHTAAVRCINFSPDGSRFLSGGFDRFLRLWDTETGQCISTITNRKVPYAAKFYPPNDNLFIFAASDNRLYTYDWSSGEMVQEYNHHLSAVNTVTFYDNNSRFASTSDDKKMLLWEWDISVPIKYIAEPGMHSMPAVTPSPAGDFVACQSLDNTIKIFGCRDRFKLLHKKVFKGHTIAGFACQPAFSPNNRYLASGDGEGKLHFWDFKNTRALAKYRAHDNGPCIGLVWHPVEASMVASCGWDGLIKLWE
ncbi:pre-mrna-processing factor 17 [Nannochloropsis gaditana]|uniref:Pre-mRNA-processing factor 17 n=1 Tax=Nannochloropsis gaditana TaxID=72520 RepID=W7TQP6_9STRA|nr:pre-mrna-processing factor 17 [Nannochloropsis gaditana]